MGLPELGFFSDDQETFERLIQLPDGIVLVTGPTGSGKTSTLYACLNYVNKPDRKIITVEEPIEYQMTGINQVQVSSDIGMTFPAALRSILRQAPNIIMIGEIRDLETASIATNASLTGHLVFSTLHTNDAPSAIARLIDIGVQPFLVASSFRAIMAQRLVRRICPHCKQPAELTESEMRALRIEPGQLQDAQVMQGRGCEQCRGSGYKGRMGIFEIFVLDDEVRHMINKRSSTLNFASTRARTRDANVARRRHPQSAGRRNNCRRSNFDHDWRRELAMNDKQQDFWGAHAARVPAMAARHRELSERLFRRAAETRRPAACAPRMRSDYVLYER